MRHAHRPVTRVVSRGGRLIRAAHDLAEEVPVALDYNGTTQAVMMASPTDLHDFAIGFSLTEHIIENISEIGSIDVLCHGTSGIELRIWLAGDRSAALAARRRRMAGPVGCGLCGIDSLSEALHPIHPVGRPRGLMLGGPALCAGFAALRGRQKLHDATRAVHAVGYLDAADGKVLLREDVGRHNALDKLIGALAADGRDACDGALLLTSRISVDLVQKAAVAQAPILAAVSAPTAGAVQLAEEAGITLVTGVREDEFEIYTHPQRLIGGAGTDVT